MGGRHRPSSVAHDAPLRRVLLALSERRHLGLLLVVLGLLAAAPLAIGAPPVEVPPKQCADTIDNDGDGLIDHPADPGCGSRNDNSELDDAPPPPIAPPPPPPIAPPPPPPPPPPVVVPPPPPPPAVVPPPAPAATTFPPPPPAALPPPPPPPAGTSGTPQCLDGDDNDNDGFVDFPADVGCGSPIEQDEAGTGIVVGSANETLRMLTPFPVVRLAGRIRSDGVRITLLTVWAPIGTKLTISCRGIGPSCPRARTSFTVKTQLTRLRAFQRRMLSGTVLRIYVTRSASVGKYTRFTIRRRTAPQRRDGCALPDTTPVTCRVSS